MNDRDPLAQLRDIQLPETGGWWPPAPGWWALAALLLLALAGALVWWWYRRQREQWRRDALAELESLGRRAQTHPDWFAELNGLLKRAARQVFPERRPEALSGNAWGNFLMASAPDHAASEQTINAMVTACWQPTPGLSPSQALGFAKAWLEAQP